MGEICQRGVQPLVMGPPLFFLPLKGQNTSASGAAPRDGTAPFFLAPTGRNIFGEEQYASRISIPFPNGSLWDRACSGKFSFCYHEATPYTIIFHPFRASTLILPSVYM